MKNKSVRIEIELSDLDQPRVEIKIEGLSVTESSSCHFISNDESVTPKLLNEVNDIHDFSKKMKGILVKRELNSIRITNDPFCSIPLYYFQQGNKVLITSEPYDFSDSYGSDIDKSGLWETILYGSCLWTRTLFKGLFQFPSAAELIIEKGSIDLARYWDFHIEEDKDLRDEKNLVDALDSKLVDIFAKLPEKQYLMGISGGLDSRLSAAYLNKTNKAHLVNTFTYCSTKKSLEYKLAQSVCENYGLKEPKLCVLDESSYRSTLEFLPRHTCGQIGIQHSHICSVLERYYSEQPYTHISNYFSDALFGYECSGNKPIQYGDDSLTKILNSVDGLDNDVRSDIESDINKLFATFNSDGNYSSLDEFKYITERNQKFHVNLAFQQSRFMDTELPYADYDLLEFMMSVPLHLRKRKKVIDLLFESGAIENYQIEDISSRHFIPGNEFSNQGIRSLIRKVDFKLQNVISALTAKVTQGKVIYPNKYHTESHVNMLHLLSSELDDSCNKLNELGVFSLEQCEFFKSIPVKSHGVSERFQILSLNKVISNLN